MGCWRQAVQLLFDWLAREVEADLSKSVEGKL